MNCRNNGNNKVPLLGSINVISRPKSPNVSKISRMNHLDIIDIVPFAMKEEQRDVAVKQNVSGSKIQTKQKQIKKSTRNLNGSNIDTLSPDLVANVTNNQTIESPLHQFMKKLIQEKRSNSVAVVRIIDDQSKSPIQSTSKKHNVIHIETNDTLPALESSSSTINDIGFDENDSNNKSDLCIEVESEIPTLIPIVNMRKMRTFT